MKIFGFCTEKAKTINICTGLNIKMDQQKFGTALVNLYLIILMSPKTQCLLKFKIFKMKIKS